MAWVNEDGDCSEFEVSVTVIETVYELFVEMFVETEVIVIDMMVLKLRTMETVVEAMVVMMDMDIEVVMETVA
jgi:hypothetical protein